jgi:hypothetical protein
MSSEMIPTLLVKREMLIVDDGLVDDADAAVKIARGRRVMASGPSLEQVLQPRRVLAKPIVTKVTRKPRKESVTARFLLGWRLSLPSSIRTSKTTNDPKTQAVVVGVVREDAADDSTAANSTAELFYGWHGTTLASTKQWHSATSTLDRGSIRKPANGRGLARLLLVKTHFFYLCVST